jgi:hypothetical protein
MHLIRIKLFFLAVRRAREGVFSFFFFFEHAREGVAVGEAGCDLVLVAIQKFHHALSLSLIHPTIICTTLRLSLSLALK